MSGSMRGSAELRYDESVPGEQVYVTGDDGSLSLRPAADALAEARARGEHLYERWPATEGQLSVCAIGALTLPPRWEPFDEPDEHRELDLDERLTFEGSCGGTDYLLGNGHTHVGRILAWCPQRDVSYRVTAGSLRGLTEAGTYWVRGFLHGTEPGPPRDEDGDLAAGELAAWRASTALFRETGLWSDPWRTCPTCGVLLLPGSPERSCADHLAGPDSPH